MEILKTLVWVINFISAFSLITLVLLQHGKGADMGAAFGSGASGSLFGASGSANFLSRATAVMAIVFFSTCLALVTFSAKPATGLGVMDAHVAPVAVTPAPVAPATAPASPSKPAGIPD